MCRELPYAGPGLRSLNLKKVFDCKFGFQFSKKTLIRGEGLRGFENRPYGSFFPVG